MAAASSAQVVLKRRLEDPPHSKSKAVALAIEKKSEDASDFLGKLSRSSVPRSSLPGEQSAEDQLDVTQLSQAELVFSQQFLKKDTTTSRKVCAACVCACVGPVP